MEVGTVGEFIDIQAAKDGIPLHYSNSINLNDLQSIYSTFS